MVIPRGRLRTQVVVGVVLCLALVAKVAASDTCTDRFHEEKGCASDKNCRWCVSAAVPSSCILASHAAKLPKDVFSCGVHGGDGAAQSATTPEVILKSGGVSSPGPLNPSEKQGGGRNIPHEPPAQIPPGGPGGSGIPADFDQAVSQAIGGTVGLGPTSPGAAHASAMPFHSAYSGKKAKLNDEEKKKLEEEHRHMLEKLRADHEQVEKETRERMKQPADVMARLRDVQAKITRDTRTAMRPQAGSVEKAWEDLEHLGQAPPDGRDYRFAQTSPEQDKERELMWQRIASHTMEGTSAYRGKRRRGFGHSAYHHGVVVHQTNEKH